MAVTWTSIDPPATFAEIRDAAAEHRVEPGTLLRDLDGGVVLVGHTNRVGGVCDDCTIDNRRFDATAVVEFDVELIGMNANAAD